ncbi:MAG TPA: ABC transporter permease [Candidatus Dormibacteraeota bacterium]
MALGPSRTAEIAEFEFGEREVRAGGTRSYWSESLLRLRSNRVAMLCGAVVLALAVIAVTAPLIALYVSHQTYSEQDLAGLFQPPSGRHWLGTDELGRDTFTRLVYGSRVSLTVGFLTVALSLLVGGTIGLTAGYYGGALDNLLMRLVDTLLSIPSIFLFILLSVLVRPNAVTLSFIIALVGWGSVARLVRAETLSVNTRDFMLATRSTGAPDRRLIFRHLLPNVLPVMIVAASLAVGQIILVEAALSYLGLGIQPPLPSWGNMLSNAPQYFYHSPWLAFYPGACIFVTVLCTNIFGNAVRDAFDPRLR